MNYLTKDELLDLHAYVLTRYGGRLGVSSQDRLITSAEASRQVLFQTELYPDLPSKAAALLFLLLKNRPFVGANEATALMALLRFLAINDAALRQDIGDAELLWLVRAVNNSDLDKAGVESWLRDNIQSLNHEEHEEKKKRRKSI